LCESEFVFFGLVVAEGLDFVGASWDREAAHVGVAVGADVVETQAADGVDVVVVLGVGVPGLWIAVSVWMEEDYDICVLLVQQSIWFQ
jgi:hypothetical protein